MSADTSPEIEQRYARLIMSRSPQHRVAMCFEMSGSARAVVRRSLEAAGVAPEELASELVIRLYGTDLSPAALTAFRQRASGRISERPAPAGGRPVR